MQLLNMETVNLLLYLFGLGGLLIILLYTAFAGEDVEGEEDED